MEEWFANAILNHKSLYQLLVIDEYQRFKGTNLEVTGDFLSQYTGSQIVVRQILKQFTIFLNFFQSFIWSI